jgi:hypothetical protein
MFKRSSAAVYVSEALGEHQSFPRRRQILGNLSMVFASFPCFVWCAAERAFSDSPTDRQIVAENENANANVQSQCGIGMCGVRVRLRLRLRRAAKE